MAEKHKQQKQSRGRDGQDVSQAGKREFDVKYGGSEKKAEQEVLLHFATHDHALRAGQCGRRPRTLFKEDATVCNQRTSVSFVHIKRALPVVHSFFSWAVAPRIFALFVTASKAASGPDG